MLSPIKYENGLSFTLLTVIIRVNNLNTAEVGTTAVRANNAGALPHFDCSTDSKLYQRVAKKITQQEELYHENL